MLVATLAFAVLTAASVHGQDRYPVRQLSASPHQGGFPTWSPDGKTLGFEDVEPEHVGPFRVSLEGGQPARFTSFIAEHPNWSPDGAHIFFDAEFGDSVKSSHGGRPVRIVPEMIPVHNGGNPIWSPDGSRIAFKSESTVCVLEIENGAFPKAFEAPGKLAVASCWSRDGNRILLWLRDRQTRESAIWSVAPGSGTKEIFAPVEGKEYRYLDQYPDGSLLAFAWCEGRECDLWVAPPGGGNAVQLTLHPSYDDTPSWSPDGSKIAFTGARTGEMDVCVMDLDLADLRTELKAVNP